MLLTIDVGNTNTVFAVHDGDGWRGQWRASTDGRRTAQFEHTLAVTADGAEVLTLHPDGAWSGCATP